MLEAVAEGFPGAREQVEAVRGALKPGSVRRLCKASLAHDPEPLALFAEKNEMCIRDRAWAGCRAGGSPVEASAQGVRFHDGFSWFCLLAASDVRSSLAARRLHATEGIALFGAVLFCCAG